MPKTASQAVRVWVDTTTLLFAAFVMYEWTWQRRWQG